MWLAIRTTPGAQMPQRQFETELTTRGKGYRIVTSLCANVSAVERALSEAGYQHYMPAEFKVIRNRKKTGVYELRRFPLLQGYMFVHGVTDFERLRGVPGVAGLLVSHIGDQRIPINVSVVDIITMRTIEANSHTKADKEVAALNSSERATLTKTAQKALAAAKRKLNAGQTVKILWGQGIGHEATLTGWEDNQHLKAILENLRTGVVEEISVPFDAVKLVA